MGEVSERTKKLVSFPLGMKKISNAVAGNCYNPTDNPNGVIPLNMGVNDCVWDIITEKLNTVDMRLMPRSYIHYQDCRGTQQFRDAIATFLSR